MFHPSNIMKFPQLHEKGYFGRQKSDTTKQKTNATKQNTNQNKQNADECLQNNDNAPEQKREHTQKH